VVRGGVLPLDEEEESADPGFRNTPSDIVIAGLIVSIPGSSSGGGSSGAVEDAVVDAAADTASRSTASPLKLADKVMRAVVLSTPPLFSRAANKAAFFFLSD